MADQHTNPFEGVTDFFTELARMREVGTHGREYAPEPRERSHSSAWIPATDIFRRGQDLVVRIEVAGVDPAQVDLSFASGSLTISGVRGDTAGGDDVQYFVRERYHGEFRRVIGLPDGVRRDQISARLDAGLLEVTVSAVGGLPEESRIELTTGDSRPEEHRID